MSNIQSYLITAVPEDYQLSNQGSLRVLCVAEETNIQLTTSATFVCIESSPRLNHINNTSE